MASYVNTARHAITLPNGRPIGPGEGFDYNAPLDDDAVRGSLLAVDSQPAEQGTDEPHDRPPVSRDVPAVQDGIPSDEAFGSASFVQAPPAEDQEDPKPAARRRQTRKRGDT
jgi:hypothetical protein